MSLHISVITAVLNRAGTLGATLRSVRDQDWPDVEHIVIDGGSADGTLAVLDAYKDGISKIISEPDRGLYDALNKGIRQASGDVIGFMHADDEFASPDALSRVASAFEDPAVGAVYGDLVYVGKDDVSRIVRYWRAGPKEADEVMPLGHLPRDFRVVRLPGVVEAEAAREGDIEREPEEDHERRHLPIGEAIEERRAGRGIGDEARGVPVSRRGGVGGRLGHDGAMLCGRAPPRKANVIGRRGMKPARLSHLDARGAARMVGVGAKPETARRAVASAEVRMSAATLALVGRGGAAKGKGDALSVARVAAVMATKRTADLIPLCHPVRVVGTDVAFTLDRRLPGVRVRVAVDAVDRTGVEMEALVGASTAALTIYDMVKGVERGVEIGALRLEEKSGGRGGVWRRAVKPNRPRTSSKRKQKG